MKKFSFEPYLDLIVVAYYILTFTTIIIFFCYVTISDRIYEQIHTKEIELQYAIDSQNDNVAYKIQEDLNLLKIENSAYMAEKLKYFFISSILIALIIIDIKIYNKMKGKKCWYTAFHENRRNLFFIPN